jgi:hypothetical protein
MTAVATKAIKATPVKGNKTGLITALPTATKVIVPAETKAVPITTIARAVNPVATTTTPDVLNPVSPDITDITVP